MKPSQIAIVLIAVGGVFGVMSLLWPAAVGGKRAYTQEDALEYQQASLELHNQTHANGPTDDESGGSVYEHEHDDHEHGPKDDAALKAAQTRMDAIEATRDAAIHKGQSAAGVFKWLGILTVAGGIFTHFATRGRE